MNVVESINDCKESPCKYGNIVEYHACYCHNDKSPNRKCPQWRYNEPYEECEYFSKNNKLKTKK